VRVSIRGTIAPSCSSFEITGSVFEMMSISPLWIAATALAVAPTPMKDASDAFRPAFDMA
jgi:hypothetical protein